MFVITSVSCHIKVHTALRWLCWPGMAEFCILYRSVIFSQFSVISMVLFFSPTLTSLLEYHFIVFCLDFTPLDSLLCCLCWLLFSRFLLSLSCCSPYSTTRCWVSLRRQALLLCLWSTLWVTAPSSSMAPLPPTSWVSCQLSWWATSSSIPRSPLPSVSCNYWSMNAFSL